MRVLGYVSFDLSAYSFRNVSTTHLCDGASCIFDPLCLMIPRSSGLAFGIFEEEMIEVSILETFQ